MFEAAVGDVRFDSCRLQSSCQVEPGSTERQQLFVDAPRAAMQLIMPKPIKGFVVVHVGLAKHRLERGCV